VKAFIVDSNIIFSGLLKEGATRKILIESPFKLYAPEILIREIEKYKEILIKKSGIAKEEFTILFHLLTEDIEIISKEKYHDSIEEAKNIIGHIDRGDIPFIALALAINNDGIWTDDAHFKKQNKIKILNTKDILSLFNKDN